MKKTALLLTVMSFAFTTIITAQGKNATQKHSNGEVWNPDGIEMVFVESNGKHEGFYIGKYEVTQAQWKTIMGDNNNLSHFKGDDLPVEMVSWDDAQEFIKKLNVKTGRNYRLPTEKEWEYAAREGKAKSSYEYSSSNDVDEVAWYGENSDGVTHKVGTKKPNALGIYDMSGNVWEWCEDCYDNSCSRRVLRGGSWRSDAPYCSVAYRDYSSPGDSRSLLGFRLVLP
jgi:formylglycine-generating enzyme required for sulfatase activity